MPGYDLAFYYSQETINWNTEKCLVIVSGKIIQTLPIAIPADEKAAGKANENQR